MKIEKNLPENWVETELEEISDPVSTSGKKIKTKDALPSGKYPVIDQGIAPISRYINDPSLLVPASIENAIIIFGDHTRIVKYVTKDFVPGADGTKLISAKNGIDSRYLKYLIQQADIPDRGYGRHYQFLKSANLSLAPENEQRRIADKLDTTVARVDALIDRLARITPLLKRFRQSVLAAATSGRLTEEFRVRGDFNLKSWTLKKLSQVSDVIDPNPKHRNPVYIEDGHVFLSTVNFKEPDGWDLINVKRVADSTLIEQAGRCNFDRFSLVFSRKGTIGKVRFVPDLEKYAFLDSLVVINANSLVNPKFLKISLKSSEMQAQIKELTRGVALKQVSVGVVRGLEIRVPELREQTEIVRRVEILFAFADRLEARLQSAQTAAERLPPALLAKAFRGELVPQDPNDEPATELLRRLREARAAQAPAKPKRGRKAAAS